MNNRDYFLNLFQSLGEKGTVFFRHVENLTFLSLGALYWIFVAPFSKNKKNIKWEHVLQHMLFMGVRSTLIVVVVSGFMGMIISMQMAYILKKFEATLYTGSLVGVSFARELGPLLAAIVLSGRVGASIAAELGTMKVDEEIEALHVMGINPLRYLVSPRILAILIMLPCLTMLADVVGIVGGFVIGVCNLFIEPMLYVQKTFDALVLKDLFTGLIKSFFFAFIIGIIGCYQGLTVKGGAEGVGKGTQNAVVVSIVLVILADCFFTALFYFVF